MIGSNLGSDILTPALGVGAQPQGQSAEVSSDADLEFADILNSQGTDSEALESTSDLEMLETPQLSHQIAMLAFMGQMKTEFNIEPEQIVTAFTQLKPEELGRPATENIQKIISQLGIPVEQQPKACLELEEMLKVTEVDDGDDSKLLAPVPLTQDALIAQMNMAQMQTAAPKPAAAVVVQADSRPDLDGNKKIEPKQDRKSSAIAPLAFGAGVGAGAAAVLAKSTESSVADGANGASASKDFNLANVTQKVSTPSSDVSAVAPETKDLNLKNLDSGMAIPKDLQMSESTLAQMPVAPFEPKALAPPDLSPTPTSTVAAGAALTGGAAAGKMLFGGGDESSEKSDKEESASLSAQAYMGDGAQAKNATDINGAGFKLDSKNPVAPQETNLKDVIGQAQFLAKKGGGEMKVQLKPEGLGEVSMSVKVQDGQVSVQMITQSGDAKKLIEHGLSELKASLQSHQLDLGIVKVDVARDASSQMDHHREQAGRQHAQGMLEDFRGQQNNQRQYASSEATARSAYRAPARESTSVGYSPALRGTQTSASRRLDLVA